MKTPENLNLKSADFTEALIAHLKGNFPHLLTESRNEKGQAVPALDFDKIRTELSSAMALTEGKKERYGLEWPGKRECLQIIKQPSVATLKPAPKESIHFDEATNVFIEGDNLETLKLLQKSYYGKIKLIYIDPPYNTGKEFIYPDKYAESLDTYLAYARLIDDQGRKFSTNTSNEGRFHTSWLNMMYPRLYLARNLLREDGAIFISIDDNEAANLKMLCNEIFGEENFISQFVWQKRYSRENRGIVGDAHEYILLYARNAEVFKDVRNLIPITESQKKIYKNSNNDPRGAWRGIPMTAQGYRPNQMYKIESPSGRVFTPPEGRCWSMIESEFLKLKALGRIYFGKEGDAQPSVIRYLDEVEGVVPWTWWPHEEVGHTDEARKEIRDVLGKSAYYDTPKPTRLLKRILEVGTNDDDIVLDFFSGSSTTAHSLLDLNAERGCRLRFILVQLPEPLHEESEAYKDGFRTVADIGKMRIKKVIEGMSEREKTQPTLKSAAATGAPSDPGFRVFKLDRSNFKIWDGRLAEKEVEKQLDLHVDHLDPNANELDVLYELLLKSGFSLSEEIKKETIAGKPTFSISDGALLIYLGKTIDKAFVEAVAAREPLHFICLDAAFNGNDQLKANAVQTFSAQRQGKDGASQITFRTV